MMTTCKFVRSLAPIIGFAATSLGGVAMAQEAAPAASTAPALPALPPRGASKPIELPRQKSLKATIGMDPVQPDFGAEADLISTIGDADEALPPKKWNRSVHAFFRAPMAIGVGPRNDGTEGSELHSPPRVPGRTSNQWDYIGLTPSPTGTLYLSAENKNVKGTLILAATTFFDTGYANLDQMGGVSQAFVTLRAPDLFGKKGGIAWNVGSFSHRYGAPGPHQHSTGYYGTHLFGRTHVAGYTITADYDVTDDVRVVLEQGLGNKLEVVPWIPLGDNPPDVDYLPDQGPVPQGSNFLHHFHAQVELGDSFTLAGHYMESFSPNDRGPVGVPAPRASLTVFGGEARYDGDKAGHAYVGYSRNDADQILPLSNALQTVYGGTGYDFAQTYFPASATDPDVPEDTGTVDTVLGQYTHRLRKLMGWSEEGPDLAMALYGMYAHVKTPTGFAQDRVKFGAELEYSPFSIISFGSRFDQVMNDGGNAAYAYQAVSPRMIIHTHFMSREYVILNYTHYFYGDSVRPAYPYEEMASPDPDLFTLTALVAF